MVRDFNRPFMVVVAIALLVSAMPGTPRALADDEKPDQTLTLTARSRVKQDDGSYRMQLRPVQWDARQTAIVICDMWDDHYCVSAAKRVAEMAPRMNEVITEARKRGVLIIHCPSGCMDKYEGTPQRKLAQQAPKVKAIVPLQRWCYLDKKHEAGMPVDATTQPCDDKKPRERKRFYTRQIETLKIEEGDAITDSAEAYYLMRQRGIKNVIIMGVHTNMCVLGRPFGIRQMVYQKQNVVLMRDMTDAMYSPTEKPKVNHFRGTELVVEHIERHWCPTVTSTDFTGKAPFRFKNDPRPYVVFVVGGGEYDANETMPNLAHELRHRWDCYCDVQLGRGKDQAYEIPGLAALENADLMVLYLRRRALRPEQMEHIRRYLRSGNPLVALRTTSHGFEAGDKASKEMAQWPKFDVEVLGCDYRGHAPGKFGTDVAVAADAASHPILAGVSPTSWHSAGSLYGSKPLDPKATLLLTGSIKDGENVQPIAWTRTYNGGRVFYTSLGHRDDFKQPHFRRLLVNAIGWAMDKKLTQRKIELANSAR